MKKIVTLAIVVLTIVLAPQSVFAQSDVQPVKKEMESKKAAEVDEAPTKPSSKPHAKVRKDLKQKKAKKIKKEMKKEGEKKATKEKKEVKKARQVEMIKVPIKKKKTNHRLVKKKKTANQ